MQVPLLLSLGELEGALAKAIDSGDTDLVYLVVFRLVDPGCHASSQVQVTNKITGLYTDKYAHTANCHAML